MGLDIFENEGELEKGWIEIEVWSFSLHLELVFQKNSIYTLQLCFTS